MELKQTKYYKVLLSPLQVSWHFRHARACGISYILVKKQCESLFKSSLYLYRGKDSLILAKNGLKHLPLKQFDYPYDWSAIRDALFKITELNARELLNHTHSLYPITLTLYIQLTFSFTWPSSSCSGRSSPGPGKQILELLR